MVPLAAGLVVLVRFPFSDLSQTKLRPAVVLANAGRGDWILCQVTSKPYADSAAVVTTRRNSVVSLLKAGCRLKACPTKSGKRLGVFAAEHFEQAA